MLIASEANAPWGARWARWARSELVRGSFGARSGLIRGSFGLLGAHWAPTIAVWTAGHLLQRHQLPVAQRLREHRERVPEGRGQAVMVPARTPGEGAAQRGLGMGRGVAQRVEVEVRGGSEG